ncbi:XrtA/PEP-CTERM system amidotransferase [Psychrobium sp. 1_MG-2023]|uniref:XrtA/PEP-CTERM system amidotransferase n=1 Tax=Psychrobium sp. 1_MG-2023 TaxID=3062624 RepID=UPI000C325A14|nr:XrtA/PEP-CTERM system amidotransferase [Psychrobium sp. 1_MG-2023]MDP2561129.1 amidotransferase 1, exosortase A system-associated [Psychrobium sp. 1_MG-2023]PKF55105.1 asparagine synthetase B [Alteromonadales bacterium alter-6D02]
MCGIAGIFDLQTASTIKQDILQKMNDIQSHRGPDDDGFYIEQGIGLGHRRLSIIDLAGGHQPMFNLDKSIGIVFNGEIYNFADLAQELRELGYPLVTNGDTETIIYAWQEWGERCVEKLRGMFAFAIWDSRNGSLFLARDRLGIKPLYYALLDNQQLIFGSELKVLKQHPDCPRILNNQAIEDYFSFGYIPEPKSIYQGVSKLAPGHTLLFVRGQSAPEPKQYWDVEFESLQHQAEQTKSTLVEKLKQAVDIRMVSEVPLGAFLSGGVDSSSVVAMMAGLQDDAVNACSIGFDVEGFDETDYAKKVASRYQASHRVKMVDSDDFELIDQLAHIYDEPYADSSALPTYRLCQMTKEHVTVALSGDGADELMAGYRRYQWHLKEQKIRELVPLAIRKPIFGLLGRIYPKLDWAPKVLRAKTTFQSMSYDWIEGYHNSMSILRSDERSRLFSEAFSKELAGYSSLEVFKQHAQQVENSDPLSQVQYIDMKTYLVGDILTKVDRASMANSLEVRVPILDHHFVEWSATIAPPLRIHKSQGKDIFKQSLVSYLPHDVLFRPKMGFSIPLAHWFRGPLQKKLEEGLLSSHMLNCGVFNPKTIRWLIDSHVKGVRDNSAALWTLLMFERFLAQEANV